MKTYNCAVEISICEGSIITSNLNLTEDKLESLNKIAISLFSSYINYGFKSLKVVQLPVPIPNDINKWYYETPREKIDFIIDSDNKDIYNNFKNK